MQRRAPFQDLKARPLPRGTVEAEVRRTMLDKARGEEVEEVALVFQAPLTPSDAAAVGATTAEVHRRVLKCSPGNGRGLERLRDRVAWQQCRPPKEVEARALVRARLQSRLALREAEAEDEETEEEDEVDVLAQVLRQEVRDRPGRRLVGPVMVPPVVDPGATPPSCTPHSVPPTPAPPTPNPSPKPSWRSSTEYVPLKGEPKVAWERLCQIVPQRQLPAVLRLYRLAEAGELPVPQAAQELAKLRLPRPIRRRVYMALTTMTSPRT